MLGIAFSVPFVSMLIRGVTDTASFDPVLFTPVELIKYIAPPISAITAMRIYRFVVTIVFIGEVFYLKSQS